MLELIAFAFAWVGHACILVTFLNVVYSRPVHRVFQKGVRAFVGLAILGFPALLLLGVGPDVIELMHSAYLGGSHLALALYVGVALVVGAGVFPIITAARLLRPAPPALLDERTDTIDVAKELGSAPAGDGPKHRWLAFPFNEPYKIDFTKLTLAVPGLPAAWDGLTILHLSDLHFYGTPSPDYFRFAMKRCAAWGTPDLVCVTGDILDGMDYLPWIREQLGSLKWKEAAFAILGNHDWWMDADAIRRELTGLGMIVLGNGWREATVRGERLIAIGCEGPWFVPEPDLASPPADGFRLLLSHTPDYLNWAVAGRVNLMLSGHNHGGQIRVPVIGSIFVPSCFGRRHDMGTFQKGRTVLHVNRGLSGKEPLRIRCHAQATWIELKKG